MADEYGVVHHKSKIEQLKHQKGSDPAGETFPAEDYFLQHKRSGIYIMPLLLNFVLVIIVFFCACGFATGQLC